MAKSWKLNGTTLWSNYERARRGVEYTFQMLVSFEDRINE